MNLDQLTEVCKKFLEDYSQCTEEDERSDVIQAFIELLEENNKKPV